MKRISYSASCSGLHPYTTDRVLRWRLARAINRVVRNRRTWASAASVEVSIGIIFVSHLFVCIM